MDFTGRLIASLVLVILIVIFPIQYIAGAYSEDVDSLVDDRTKKLTDKIRKDGVLYKDMYENYTDFLHGSGEKYELEIHDIHPVANINSSLIPTSNDSYSLEDSSKIRCFDITYTKEILDTVYSTGCYVFDESNYISIIVIKNDKSLLYKLQNTFFRTSLLGRKRRFIYGGEVRWYE